MIEPVAFEAHLDANRFIADPCLGWYETVVILDQQTPVEGFVAFAVKPHQVLKFYVENQLRQIRPLQEAAGYQSELR